MVVLVNSSKFDDGTSQASSLSALAPALIVPSCLCIALALGRQLWLLRLAEIRSKIRQDVMLLLSSMLTLLDLISNELQHPHTAHSNIPVYHPNRTET
jgi:hypothetical protein